MDVAAAAAAAAAAAIGDGGGSVLGVDDDDDVLGCFDSNIDNKYYIALYSVNN